MTPKRNPIDSRCYRAESWMNKLLDSNGEDLDAKFIFCWIAFNALYGQPKYLPHRKGYEWNDIDKFLSCLTDLDTVGQIKTTCTSKPLRDFIYDLTTDQYLNDDCWEATRPFATGDDNGAAVGPGPTPAPLRSE